MPIQTDQRLRKTLNVDADISLAMTVVLARVEQQTGQRRVKGAEAGVGMTMLMMLLVKRHGLSQDLLAGIPQEYVDEARSNLREMCRELASGEEGEETAQS